ncbi:MAG: primosomal protein N' [Kiritimatiellae bacterium]|nr:primosomal protein N' [Kiritimatiellia bacterium]
MQVSVAIDLALDRLFTYLVPVELTEKLLVGQLLRVPFGGRIVRGFAMSLKDDADVADGDERKFKLKPVMAIEDASPFFSPKLLELVKWIAGYTSSPIETTLKAALPAAVLKPTMKPKELLYVDARDDAGEDLTPQQQKLLAEIRRVGGGWMQQLVREFKTSPSTLRAMAEKGALEIAPRAQRRDPLAGRSVMPTRPLQLNDEQAAALKSVMKAVPVEGGAAADPRPVLLHGVTGSGKTEIYLQAIASVLETGRDAIVLVPEIALTPQTVRRFAGRFGEQVAVLHSALSDGERYDEWQRIRTGAARVVVGPRSAVFAPVRSLGLIVVDEEHDPSYKQGETPRYHARDVAVVRARLEGAAVVLGSATPSLESWRNAQTGKYALVSVKNRVTGRTLPAVHLVNMEEEAARTGHAPIFSAPLLDAIHLRLERGEQTILFLNRRGYSRVLECQSCGWTAQCPDCSVPYTYHQADRCLRCHVCGGWTHLPSECPDCKAGDFSYTGVGTQRAEAALKRCFAHARVLRMDADSTSRRFSHDDILSTFRAGKADVLLGTQMIAKGLDFPNVTLVGVLNADTSLNRPDPRASERTYQLLAQVSGRAGRAEKPGEVYLQTFSPDAPAIAAAASDRGFAAFAEDELAARREAYLPPFCRLSTLVFRATDEALASAWAELYAKSLAAWAAKFNSSHGAALFRVSESAEAPLAKAEGWFRYQVVIRAPSTKDIVKAVKWIEAERPAPKELRIAFDVDAIDLA